MSNIHAAALVAISMVVSSDPAPDGNDPRWWIAEAHEAIGRIDLAADQMIAAQTSSVLEGIARLYVAAGDHENARRAVLDAQTGASARLGGAMGISGQPLATLIDAQVRSGDHAGASETVRQVVTLAERERERAADIAADADELLTWSAGQQARLGEWASAIDLAGRIHDLGGALDAWIAIAEARLEAGLRDEALASLERIRGELIPALEAVPRRGGRHQPGLASWQVRRIARLYSEVDLAAGLELARTLSPFERIAAEEMIEHLCERGRFADARWIAANVLGEDNAARRVAEARLHANDVRGAMATVTDIDDERDRSRVREAIVAALLARDDVAQARTTASSIQDVAIRVATITDVAEADLDPETRDWVRRELGRVPFEQLSDWTLIDVVRSLCAIGDLEAAGVAAAQIDDLGHRDWARVAVVEAMAHGGELDGAELAAGGITSTRDRDGALIEVATARARAGDLAGARRTAVAIHDPVDRAVALAALIEAQFAAGSFVAARMVADEAMQLAAGDRVALTRIGLALSAGSDSAAASGEMTCSLTSSSGRSPRAT